MAATLLSEEEYQFLTQLEKDLLERAKTASPRASTHLRAVAKMHSDFLALENGKRAAAQKRAAAKQEHEALKLQRQQERLANLQQQMQNSKQDQQTTTSQGNTGQRQQSRTNASASA